MSKSILIKSIEMLVINQVLKYNEKEIATFVKFVKDTCPTYKNTDIVIDDIVLEVTNGLYNESLLKDPNFYDGEYNKQMLKITNVQAELFSTIAYAKILYSEETDLVKDIEIDKLKKFMDKFNISKEEIYIVAKELYGITQLKKNSLS